MRVTRFPKKIPGLSLSKFHSYLLAFDMTWLKKWEDSLNHSRPSFPHKKKSPKEGEIAYRPVSRSAVCVCTFLIEANSSAYKKSADRDPVLHNLQFVDAQIRADCRVCTSIIFCETICLTAAFSRGTRYKLVPVYNWWRKQEILSGVWVEARHEWMKM